MENLKKHNLNCACRFKSCPCYLFPDIGNMVFYNNLKILIMSEEELNKELEKLMNASGRGLRYNEDKLRYDLIPPIANRECAKVWTKSLEKYPENNWEKGMPWSEVIASAMRHLEAIRLGEDLDPEDGLLHAAHLQCNAAMLTEYYFTKQEFDNRKKNETK